MNGNIDKKLQPCIMNRRREKRTDIWNYRVASPVTNKNNINILGAINIIIRHINITYIRIT